MTKHRMARVWTFEAPARVCTACEGFLEADVVPNGEHGGFQYDNALWISFHGGYGMFVESQSYVSDSNAEVLRSTGATYEAVICHECAHRLCDENPWLSKLIQPASSHSHKTTYVEANPDHYGWDYDMEKQRARSD